MLYVLAAVMFILSIALPGTNSDLATIGGFIFLGLALHANAVRKK